jgi:hypothetical protein
MYVDAFKSSIDVLLNVPLTLLIAPLMFFHAPLTILKNPQTSNDTSLARPLKVPKEVGFIKNASKGSTYLPTKVL